MDIAKEVQLYNNERGETMKTELKPSLKDEWYGNTFKCPFCNEEKLWRNFKFCPMCGKSLEDFEFQDAKKIGW